MRHFRVHARLGADAEVIHHAVLCSEVLSPDGVQEGIHIHEALVDLDATVAGEHASRAVGIVSEHGLDLRDAGLASPRRGNADDAHSLFLLLVYLEAVPAGYGIHPSAGAKSQRLSVSDRNFISELFQTDVPRVIEALRIDDQYGQRAPAGNPDGGHRAVHHGVQAM